MKKNRKNWGILKKKYRNMRKWRRLFDAIPPVTFLSWCFNDYTTLVLSRVNTGDRKYWWYSLYWAFAAHCWSSRRMWSWHKAQNVIKLMNGYVVASIIIFCAWLSKNLNIIFGKYRLWILIYYVIDGFTFTAPSKRSSASTWQNIFNSKRDCNWKK